MSNKGHAYRPSDFRDDSSDEGFNTLAALYDIMARNVERASEREHYHRCTRCSHIWHHNEREVYANDDSECAFNRAHACPKCAHEGCIDKFYTEEQAKTAPKRWRERNEAT